jgi:TetR/AcrR family transcriptional regulator, fatty acid biosynthesis regulator
VSSRVKRSRLDPQARKDLILDAAAHVVTTEGLAAVSMERLGRQAGVSKGLVYNYFPNRTLLLQSLLLRENRDYDRQQREAAESARDVETMVRVTTRTYLEHIAEKGILIQRLLSEPAIGAATSEMEEAGRRQAMDYLSTRLNLEHPLPPAIAALMVELTLGLTGAGGNYLDRKGCDLALLEDMLVDMILAAINAVRMRHTTWRNTQTLVG